MPGGGQSQRWPAVAVAAGFMLLLILAAIPVPAQAIYGEQTIQIHDAFVITYNNISGSDIIWWDWRVTQTIVNMTFWILLSDPEITAGSAQEGNGQLTIHKEFTSQSSGEIRPRDGYHTATVKWSCHAIRNVTFRYHVMLNPPDMTLAYSVVAAFWILPFAAMALFVRRERLGKTKPETGPSGK